ncbi:MAG: hypothetical protein ACKPKO_46345 [Candidatus Fonsibacter sp.]
MLSLWQVEDQVAKNRRDQLLNECTQHPGQLDSVLAEFREPLIVAAKDLKVAVANSKKQASVG